MDAFGEMIRRQAWADLFNEDTQSETETNSELFDRIVHDWLKRECECRLPE